MTERQRGILLMITFVALWAIIEALAARVLRVYSPYQVVFTRYLVHLALMAAIWGWRDPRSLWRTRRPGLQWGRSLLMLGMPASWVLAAQRGIDFPVLMSIFWLSPLMMLAFAALILGERVPVTAWVTSAVAWLGVVVVLAPTGLVMRKAMLLPFAMAATFSLYVVLTRSLRSETTRANLFYTALGVALPLSLAMPRLWATPGLVDAAAMVSVGVLGFVALWAVDRMTAVAPVHAAAPFAFLQFAFTVAIEAAMHGVMPGARALAGFAVITLVALYLWGREPRRAVEAVPA